MAASIQKKRGGVMKKFFIIILAVCMVLLNGCAGKDTEEVDQEIAHEPGAKEQAEEDGTDGDAPKKEKQKDQQEELEPEILKFVDVFGEEYEVEIHPEIAENPYDPALFVHEGYKLSYTDAEYTSRLGVDVSAHQGEIDWVKVKSDGYDFAFIRIGFRGYGDAGTLNLDKEFQNNVKNAQAAGLDVGVYFFAQAVNEQEAKEEADFVLENLAGQNLQLPVVYDPEHILDDEARTDGIPGEQFTKNTKVFCEQIKEGGYEAMIYSNMLWEAFELDLQTLSDYPVWYADYEEKPQTPYHFVFWQYTNEGAADGISGNVDLNIQLMHR